jgi:hypothetical protein
MAENTNQELGLIQQIARTGAIETVQALAHAQQQGMVTSQEDLTELKEHYISTFNIMANSILSKTDWYVIRKLERNIDIPQEISEFRSSVINNCNEICETIKASEDVETLKIAIINSEWNYI